MSSFERLFGDGRELEQAKGILALDAAAQTGDAAQVLELIQRGVDVNRQSSEDGATPLHYAAERGHLDAARVLLDHGAQVDVRAGPHQTPHGLVGQGNTPLIFAAAEGHCEMIELLLDRGASIDMSNTVGSSTPLFLAAQRGKARAVEVLLRRGADPRLKTDRGVLPLHIAAERGYLEVVKLLLAYCPPGSEELFEQRPAEINMVLYGHRSPADVPTLYDRDTPLHDAAQNGHEAIVALMLERGADPDSVDRIGNTPLHVASHSGHAAVVRRLVAGGADPSIKNNAGYSAADLACQRPGTDARQKAEIIAALDPRAAKGPTDFAASDPAKKPTDFGASDLNVRAGDAAMAGGDYQSALLHYGSAAEMGLAAGQHNLGHLYQEGKGVPVDYARAMQWYRKAADQGAPISQVAVGLMRYHGLGVPRDYTEALKWIRRGAEQGFAPGQFFLGQMYGNGTGVQRDRREALKWFDRAAQSGHPGAIEARNQARDMLSVLDAAQAEGGTVVGLGTTESTARQTSTAVQSKQQPAAARAPAPSPSNKAAARPTVRRRTFGDYVFRFFFFLFFGLPGLYLMVKPNAGGFSLIGGAVLLAICFAGWVWTLALFVLHLTRKVSAVAGDFAAGVKAFKKGLSDDA